MVENKDKLKVWQNYERENFINWQATGRNISKAYRDDPEKVKELHRRLVMAQIKPGPERDKFLEEYDELTLMNSGEPYLLYKERMAAKARKKAESDKERAKKRIAQFKTQ